MPQPVPIYTIFIKDPQTSSRWVRIRTHTKTERIHGHLGQRYYKGPGTYIVKDSQTGRPFAIARVNEKRQLHSDTLPGVLLLTKSTTWPFYFTKGIYLSDTEWADHQYKLLMT